MKKAIGYTLLSALMYAMYFSLIIFLEDKGYWSLINIIPLLLALVFQELASDKADEVDDKIKKLEMKIQAYEEDQQL